MAQVSYGTITITDTNDIEEVYMIYAGSSGDTQQDMPTWTYAAVTGGSIWKRDISQITGDYVWQSTVITKSGVTVNSTNWQNFYNTPVCITGPEGQGGKGISNITIQYCNYGTGTPADTGNHWQDTIPAYDSSKPNYWTKTTITYTTGNPFVKKVLDQGITQAVYNSAMANSIAQSANENANGALSQSGQALRRVQAKYGTSSTVAATAAKAAVCEGFELFNGAEVFIQFTYKNTVANPTLNVNNTGAKSIKDSDGNNLAEQFYWKDNSLVHFVYDGTNWRILDIVTTEKYNNLVSDIDGVSSTVGQHTEQISGLGTRVSTNETNISQTATSITSLVSNQDTYTAPDGTTKTNTIKSAIKQNADNISLRVEKNGVIAAINASTESSGGSAVKISADKVNIEGAAIFTSGRLSTTNLENTIDGRIPDISGLATKATAIKRTQRIYYRSSAVSNGSPVRPNTPGTASSNWVTETGNKWNSNATTTSGWTTKVSPLTDANNNKFMYLWTCEQTEVISATNPISYSTVLLDDSTTIIDGGTIITGSIAANAIKADSGTFATALIPQLTISKIDTLQTALDGKAASGAENTALSYLSYDSTNGLKIAGSNPSTTTTNYVQITSNNINIVKSSTYKATIDATNGLLIYAGDASNAIAQFGSTMRIGKANNSAFHINSSSLQAYYMNGNTRTLYFEVSPTGIKYGPSLNTTVATVGDIPTTIASFSDVNNYATKVDAQGYANTAETNASYSVEIKVSTIDYDAGTATLVATPYHQGSTSMPTGVTISYQWYKDSVSNSNPDNRVGTNNNTLNVTSSMGLDHVYICVIS